MNKILLAALFLAAAGTAAVVFRAKTPTYEAPKVEQQATIPTVLASTPAAGEVVREFDVEGMCCGGCAPKIYAAISKAPGVREAAVVLGKATVITKSDVDVSALEQAMTFDDYVAHVKP